MALVANIAVFVAPACFAAAAFTVAITADAVIGGPIFTIGGK